MLARDLDQHQLHGIQPVVQVADMDAAIAYYRDTLGFEVDFVFGDPPIHARVSSGDREHASAVRIRLVPFEGVVLDPTVATSGFMSAETSTPCSRSIETLAWRS